MTRWGSAPESAQGPRGTCFSVPPLVRVGSVPPEADPGRGGREPGKEGKATSSCEESWAQPRWSAEGQRKTHVRGPQPPATRMGAGSSGGPRLSPLVGRPSCRKDKDVSRVHANGKRRDKGEAPEDERRPHSPPPCVRDGSGGPQSRQDTHVRRQPPDEVPTGSACSRVFFPPAWPCPSPCRTGACFQSSPNGSPRCLPW